MTECEKNFQAKTDKIFQSQINKEHIKEEYLSLYRRLEVGLPIDKKEYDRLINLYHDINEGKVPVQESVKKIILRRG